MLAPMSDLIFSPPLIVYTFILTLCWATVSTRVYVKKVILKSFTADDWLMLVSLACITILIGFITYITTLGFGQHLSHVPNENVVKIFKVFLFAEVFYITCTVTLKLSITILLLRITSNQGIYRVIILSTAIFYFICGIAFFFILMFQCIPVSSFWDLAPFPSGPHNCIPRPVFAKLIHVNAAISLVTDGVFAIVPIVIVSKTQMNLRMKITTGVVLGLGLTTVGVNIARFFYIPGLGTWEDSTYNILPITITSLLEIGIGIITASLATLRPLMRKISEKFQISFASLRSTRSDSEVKIETQELSPVPTSNDLP